MTELARIDVHFSSFLDKRAICGCESGQGTVRRESAGRPFLICMAFHRRPGTLAEEAIDLTGIDTRLHQHVILQASQLLGRLCCPRNLRCGEFELNAS